MSNEIHIKAPKINLDDLIKLSHLDVVDYLIKRSAEDVEKLDELDMQKVAEIVSRHYEQLFTKEFLNRYEEKIQEIREMV